MLRIVEKGLKASKKRRLHDVLIVAPYNAQVSDLSNRLPPNAQVGTVDKFQASAGGDLLDDALVTRGCAARNGISLQPEPAQCRDVAGSSSSDRGRPPSSVGARVPQSAAKQLANALCPFVEMALVAEAPSNTRSAAPVQKADHCSQLELPLSLLISPRCNACADEGIVRQTNRIGLISDPITIDGVPFDPSIARLDRR
jgi:hypothetical protein